MLKTYGGSGLEKRLPEGPMGISAGGGRMGGGMGPLGIGLMEPAGGGGTPPGLRDAGDEFRACGRCEHYRGEEGGCEKFGGYKCQPSQVCDAFEQMEAEGEESEGMDAD